MKNMTLILALFVFAACNRDAVERDAPHDLTTTEAASTATNTGPVNATSTNALVPIGTTSDTAGTTANTVTTQTPTQGGAQTTTRAITEQPPKDAAPAPTQQIAAGQSTYNQSCASCHGANGRTAAGNVTLASKATQSKPDAQLAKTLRDNPAHKNLGLQQAQIDQVVAYVKALQ
jgi:mono/diheme cytochrome c family protein